VKAKWKTRDVRLFFSSLSIGVLLLFNCTSGASFLFDSPRSVQCDVWQTSDGLPNHDVVSLIQTHDGYIWAGMVGLSNSLARFNGFEFAPVVDLAAGDPKAVTCMALGKDGRLWISRSSGTGSLVLLQQGRVTLIKTTLPPSFGLGIPIHEDAKGNLWIGGGGLLVRSLVGQIKDLGTAAKDFGEIRQIVDGRDQDIWLATEHGPVRYRNGVFDQPYPITNSVCSIYFSKAGSLWVGTDTEPGLFQIAPAGNIICYDEAKGLKSRGVMSICEDQESNIWLGTYFGLYCVKESHVNLVPKTDLRTAFIFSLLWDHENSLWVGTSDGLYHLYVNPIEQYGAEDGLGAINSLSAGPSGLWISTFSRGTYLLHDDVLEKQPELGDSSGDGQLFEAANGDIWHPELNAYGLFRNGRPKEVEEIIGSSAIFCDDGKTLWIVNSTNIFSFKGDKISPTGKGWPAMTITTVVTNRGGGLLIGTTHGLYKWDRQLIHWSELGSNRISDLEWEGATLWVAAAQRIARYQDQHWKVIGTEADILTKTGGINSMLVENGSLWLGCVNGLFCIRRSELEQFLCGKLGQVGLTQYGKAQGMRSGYLGPTGCGNGAIRGRDGKLWFASKIGVVAVNAKELLNPKPPPVAIESIMLDDNLSTNDSNNPDDVIKVPAGTQNIDIHFAALTFISPYMTVYKYRLLGLDTNWVTVGNSRMARFTKLSPGNYHFQMQACNAGGLWNEEGASVHFDQEPFFRQTRTFAVLICLVCAAAIFGLTALAFVAAHSISARKARRQLALLEAQQVMDRERARIARDIHDDVGSSLTRIVLLSELATREPEQINTPDGHLAGIRSAAREITRRLDEIVWAINPRNDTLDSLVTYISKLTADQARAAGLNCRLELPPSIPSWPITSSTRHNIFLACKEAIHNSLKHASASQLQLRLTLLEDGFLLEICDNGVGMPVTPAESVGDGLVNMVDRLTASGGFCEITSVPGRGTVVGFRLPRRQGPEPLSTKQAT
jgi:signal transduction histidine kinase/ligand-binding sensor domain-containing protein